ncbi:helix-turn-helix domain-containing protein [Actinomyces bouchesdurhonensis]|uniref:helix-turn-helix domain-containing protein n=1 Tax=Actinomyces bouchesdurhonensis TaxID=1852361 RepID=UPI003AF0CB9B
MTTVHPFAPDRWYSAQQVQETLSLSRSTVERLGVEGKVAAIKIGHSVRYSGDDLNRQCQCLGSCAAEKKSSQR